MNNCKKETTMLNNERITPASLRQEYSVEELKRHSYSSLLLLLHTPLPHVVHSCSLCHDRPAPSLL